jgi:dihydroorotate dehydrogenase
MRPYDLLFYGVFRHMDPERAHRLAFGVIRALPFMGQRLVRWLHPDSRLQTRVLGIDFPSPFGLAAGFDKNAEGITALGALGFGHVEVGTVTRHPQPGNPKPRMFRLIADRALINRMGFNNQGSAAALPRIARSRMPEKRPVIGVNIGKSRKTEVEDATEDYLWSARRLAPVADYLAINVSSPNTPGLRGLQQLEALEPLLHAVRSAAGETPVLVKIAPDLTDDQIEGIVSLAVRLGLSGIIATNTTVSRSSISRSRAQANESGGLSGEPLKTRSLQVLRIIKRAAPEGFAVISVGGVTDGQDVLERLRAGADLVQGFTAFIYEGPLWAHRINKYLVRSGWSQPRQKEATQRS